MMNSKQSREELEAASWEAYQTAKKAAWEAYLTAKKVAWEAYQAALESQENDKNGT